MNNEDGESPEVNDKIISWSASESVEHSRGVWWYVILAVLTLAIVGLGIWTKQWTLAGLAVIAAVTIIVVIKQPPREIRYELSNDGLSIDGQLKPFADFRAFGVRQDGALWQLVLIPVKRFSMSVTLFINNDQGEQIVDFIGARLPMEKVDPDMVDKLTRRLKL